MTIDETIDKIDRDLTKRISKINPPRMVKMELTEEQLEREWALDVENKRGRLSRLRKKLKHHKTVVKAVQEHIEDLEREIRQAI